MNKFISKIIICGVIMIRILFHFLSEFATIDMNTSYSFFIFGIIPYVIVIILAFFLEESYSFITLFCAVFLLTSDAFIYWLFFISPVALGESISGLIFFLPFINIFILIPLGMLVGWMVISLISKIILKNRCKRILKNR
jgi:hypothetical protein